MELNVLVLAGDGVGPEVVAEAVRVLSCVASKYGHCLRIREEVIGAGSLLRHGAPITDAVEKLAASADAVLLGAVGLPEFQDKPMSQRPEGALFRLRKILELFTNLRPVRALPATAHASPLKSAIIAGVDLLIVRELTGGLYYGEPRGVFEEGGRRRAVNTMTYSSDEIERIARLAFRLAAQRRRKLSSVDKSNVLENSRLWRQVVSEVARDFPDVVLEHLLVDTCAMQLIQNPARFDVVLTENMFGDILSDEASVLAGSIGMLPSASLGKRGSNGVWPGLYEPVHGSAPDIAGKGIANPLGAIGSVAAMLECSFGLTGEASAVGAAVEAALNAGHLTADLLPAGAPATTAEIGDAVCEALCS